MNLEYKNPLLRAFLLSCRFLVVTNIVLGYELLYRQYATRSALDIIGSYVFMHLLWLCYFLYIWKLSNLYIKDRLLLYRDEIKQKKLSIQDITEISCNAKHWSGRTFYISFVGADGKKDEIKSILPTTHPKKITAKFLADITKINPSIKLSGDCEKWKQEYLANDTKALAKY